MTPKDYLTNKNFCPIPWTGLMYNFDGSIKNCIRSAGTIGNLHNESIENIINGEINNQTKKNMLDNQPGSNCYPCYNLEHNKKSFEIISDRVFYIKELKKTSLDVYENYKNFNLQTIDVRWSNLCNFACVYCSPEFSSKWEQEKKITIKTPGVNRQKEFESLIFKNAPNLTHVYLAGGEPLLIKQNLELLKLVSNEVNLRINTNLSKTDTQIFEKVCEFKNVHWIISLEAIEDEYEYIRYGGKWNDFLDNLKIIKRLNHKISFNMLHFALNSISIFKCIDYLKNLGFHNNSFIVGALLEPMALNIRQLPYNMLKLAKEELIDQINKKPGFLLENGLKNVLHYIEQPFESNTKQLFQYLQTLDKSRNLDSRKIFKELYNYGN